MNGAALASSYAFPPNSHGYCGARTFAPALGRFLGGNGTAASLEKEIRKFPVHYAYLRLIARENGLQPFDLEVVRAFWTGNRLLDSVDTDSLRSFLAEDLFQGRQRRRAALLCRSMPEGLVPHHSFNPLFVNFVTDAVERSVENFDSCCVTWGEVLSVEGSRARVRRRSIGWSGKFVFRTRTGWVDLERDGIRFIRRLEKGDVVSVHWGMMIERLGERDRSALERYTKMNMGALADSGMPGLTMA
jgi:hypothetical protein